MDEIKEVKKTSRKKAAPAKVDPKKALVTELKKAVKFERTNYDNAPMANATRFLNAVEVHLNAVEAGRSTRATDNTVFSMFVTLKPRPTARNNRRGLFAMREKLVELSNLLAE